MRIAVMGTGGVGGEPGAPPARAGEPVAPREARRLLALRRALRWTR